MNANYKMSKLTKRFLSTSFKGERKDVLKKLMINAEMAASKMKFVKLKDIIKPEGE